MRAFIDSILAFISAASLSDLEFETFTVNTPSYSVELYKEMMRVLDAREVVSNTRDQLTFYFQARGVAVVEPSAGSSNIFIGSPL